MKKGIPGDSDADCLKPNNFSPVPIHPMLPRDDRAAPFFILHSAFDILHFGSARYRTPKWRMKNEE